MTMDSYATRGNQANRIKAIQAITAVEKCMKKFGIPKPPPGQRSRLHHDLPSAIDKKEAEVLRRFKYTNLHPKSINEIAEKLNDLLVYAEIGKTLKSEMIALAVLKKLQSFEKEITDSKNAFQHTQQDYLSRRNFSEDLKKEMLKRQANVKRRDQKVIDDLKQYEEKGFIRRLTLNTTISPFIFSSSAVPQKDPQKRMKSSLWRNLNLYAVNVHDKVREDLEKYREIGTVKKQLYCMPQYFRDRERKGVKLPENVLNPRSKDVNIKIQDFETKMGRVVAKEHEERKKIELLKQKLNPVSIKLPIINK